MRKNFSVTILVLVLAMGFIANFIIWSKMASGGFLKQTASLVFEEVSAQEIYPMFLCPCCGKALDPKNICCETAKERIATIDKLVKEKKSKDEVILEYVQTYGLNSFADKAKQQEFKDKIEKSAPAERPQIEIGPSLQDLGNVSQAKGITTTTFEIANTGKKDLVINKIETSCGCTTASIVYQGKESPQFGMPGHGLNENVQGWQVVIAPGDKAQLRVYYDPNVHKDLRGFVIREISVFSNDPIDFEKKVQIQLTQVK